MKRCGKRVCPAPLFMSAVVRCLTGDDNLVWMAFKHTCIGDACELCMVKVLNILGTAISHTRPQSSDKLVDDLLNKSFVRNTSGNALGYKFLGFRHT